MKPENKVRLKRYPKERDLLEDYSAEQDEINKQKSKKLCVIL